MDEFYVVVRVENDHMICVQHYKTDKLTAIEIAEELRKLYPARTYVVMKSYENEEPARRPSDHL